MRQVAMTFSLDMRISSTSKGSIALRAGRASASRCFER